MDASLEDLLDRERILSRSRQRLHRRIEYLQAGGADEPALATLARLRAEERIVSRDRRELHAEIDRLRAMDETPEPV